MNLTELRDIIQSRDVARVRALHARPSSGGASSVLGGDDFQSAFQSWQMGGYGSPCSLDVLLSLVEQRELSEGDGVHALITLCSLLGESISRYTFKSYADHHEQIRESFAALGVSGDELPVGEVLWHEWKPPIAIREPKEGLPSVYTFEGSTVKTVGEKVAKRGLHRERWGRFLEGLDEARANDPAVASVADPFVAVADGLLKKYPALAPQVDETLSDTMEYGLNAANLGYAERHLEGLREATVSDAAGDVFEEMARWYDEAAAANQGIVILWC